MKAADFLILFFILQSIYKPILSQLEELKDILNQFVEVIIEDNSGDGKCIYQYYEWEKYKRYPSNPELMMEILPGYTKAFPECEVPDPEEMGRMIGRFSEILLSKIGAEYRLMKDPSDPYRVIFDGKRIPKPVHLLKHWRDDEEFCRQYIQGLNPMMIKICQSIEEIPPDMLSLKAQARGIKELISEKRLFIVDYKIIADLPHHLNFAVYAPIILLYKHLPDPKELDQQSKLMVLGIQLTRKPRNNVIYTPKSPPNRYLFAKIHVASADSQVHHFVYHLGFSHIYVEPFIVAYNNNLRRTNHTLTLLLEPHVYKTIFMNFLGRITLIAPVNPTTNTTLSVGTAGAIKLFLKVFTNSTFFERSFPEDLRSRGFTETGDDKLENYYYRDDGFKLWNAIYNYVKAFVYRVYPSDYAVLNDKELKSFAADVSSPDLGRIITFPRTIQSRKKLIDCLTVYIFAVSGQHSAVGFPQEPYNAYIPNRPQTLTNFMPDGERDIDISFIYSSLPDEDVSDFQFLIAHLLSLPSVRTLTTLQNLQKIFPDIHNNFQTELHRISSDIQRRNKILEDAGKVPYVYLDPQFVAASVDI